MATALTVQTNHRHANLVVKELAEYVEDGALVLLSANEIGEGDWVRFEVLLVDDSAVLEGIGRCSGSAPSERLTGKFDVLLEQLQLDPRNEIMFERILLAHESLEAGEPWTGPVNIADVPQRGTHSAPPKRGSSPPPLPTVPRAPKVTAPTPRTAPPPVPGSAARSTAPPPPVPTPLEKITEIPPPTTVVPPPAAKSASWPPKPPEEVVPFSGVELPKELEARVESLLPALRRKRMVNTRRDAIQLALRIGLAALEEQTQG